MAIKVGAPGTKTVRFEAGTWYDATTGHTHLTIPGHRSFHTTVTDNPGSDRCHENLLRKLKQVLVEAERWPE